MKLDVKRDNIQRAAKDAWIEAGMIGGLEMTTGVGKAIAALHCCTTVPKGYSILFLAETTSRYKDIQDDITKYKEFFGIDILKDYVWEQATYQAAYKWENRHYDIVIADEYHFAMTPQYAKFFKNNTYERLVGLSATLKDNVFYGEQDDPNRFSKRDLLNEICPVVYTYDINQSNAEGTSRKKIIFAIDHHLDTVNKTVDGGSKKKPFKQTEQAAYEYWNNQLKRAFYADESSKQFKINYTSQRRAKVLYTAESKKPIVDKLLKALKTRTIVFGNNLDALIKITTNTISSRNSDKVNDKIREDFETGKIEVIGSFKKMEQGSNLKDLDNVIIHSYYGKSRPVIQRLGRIRVDEDKEHGFVFIIRTRGTQEEKWFDNMIEDLTDFEIIHCENVDKAIKTYKEYLK